MILKQCQPQHLCFLLRFFLFPSPFPLVRDINVRILSQRNQSYNHVLVDFQTGR